MKTSLGAQNKKTGSDALGTAEMILGAQNMRTRPNALGIVGNEFERAKHENRTRHTRDP
jgi:hypothetical protein